MRKILLTAAAFFLLAGAAQAQVAAPSLSPFGLGENPAVLPFSGSSRIGAAILDVEQEITSGGVTSTLASGDGMALELRLIGETFSFGVTSSNITVDLDPALNPGGGSFESDSSTLALALLLGDSFAIGLGQISNKDTISSVTFNEVTEETLTSGGLVWKLGDTFYLGGTAGTETVDLLDNGGVQSEGDHGVTALGAGWYWRDGSKGFHAEAFKRDTESLDLKDAGGITRFLKTSETTGITLEVLFSNILLGVETSTADEASADFLTGFAVQTNEIKSTDISIGYAPEEGLAIVLGLLESEDTDQNGQVVSFSATALGFSWLF